jgi:uncharacterized protein YeeX (DUF496 family)
MNHLGLLWQKQCCASEEGFYVPPDDPQAIAKGIVKAMKSDKGKDARERIMKKFCLEKREKELAKRINELSVSHTV